MNHQKDPWPSLIIQNRTTIVVAAHGLLIALALFTAFILAYNFRFTQLRGDTVHAWLVDLYLPLLLIALPTKLLIFHWTGQHQGSWRYVGLRDLFGVISASLVGTFLFLSLYFLVENIGAEPWIDQAPIRHLRQSSVFSLDLAATIAMVCGARILVRFYYEDIQPQRSEHGRRILIVGAGDAGEALLRELLRSRQESYDCVGYLDDDVPQLHGRIHGVEILARTDRLREICEQHEVRNVFIALPQATPKLIRELVERCEGLGVHFRTIPAVTDVIEGRVKVSQLRNVEIADLLGREPVELDMNLIGKLLCGRRVLVSGAGGSIGSELVRQIAAFQPERLILVEQTENTLFEIDQELRRSFPNLEVVPLIADVTDRIRIDQILTTEKPSTVFHAAAHKHVPMMESNAGEAIKNNIGGTAVIADACLRSGVEKMVMISTDKAVNPTSMMGCTKRVAELYVQSLTDRGVTQFVTVRFGNVLGSSGSVVPIFRKQIERGGPVIVTHPEMKRYFMTIPEAAQLVLQAGTMGKGGEIYVLHMGEPVKIVDLARDMITLSGLRPGLDIEITFSGIRPGEKLFEELSNEGEDIGDTAHPKIGIWKHRPADPHAVAENIARLLQRADAADVRTLKEELQLMVPEYQWSNTTPADQESTPTTPTPTSTPTTTPS